METLKKLLGQLKQKKDVLDKYRPLPAVLIKNLSQWFHIELTYTSNAIEGNTLTRSETAVVVEKGCLAPKYNGNVERANGTAKYEFYVQYDSQPNFHVIRKKLQKFIHFYNSFRPHQGIDLLPPKQFFDSIKNEASQSHMS